MEKRVSKKGEEIFAYLIPGEIDGVPGTFEYFFTPKGLLIHRFFNVRDVQNYAMQWDAIDARAIETNGVIT